MHTNEMISILEGRETAPSTLQKVNVGVSRTSEVDRSKLVDAVRACVQAHEAAGRVVAGGLFLPYAGSFRQGIVGVDVFAVGRHPDDRLRHCYVTAELPGIQVSSAVPSQGYPQEAFTAFGIMLDVSRALTRHVGPGRAKPAAGGGAAAADPEAKGEPGNEGRKKRRRVPAAS